MNITALLHNSSQLRSLQVSRISKVVLLFLAVSEISVGRSWEGISFEQHDPHQHHHLSLEISKSRSAIGLSMYFCSASLILQPLVEGFVKLQLSSWRLKFSAYKWSRHLCLLSSSQEHNLPFLHRWSSAEVFSLYLLQVVHCKRSNT